MQEDILQAIRVLIIEDDPLTAASMSLTLTEFGFTIEGPAHSLEKALELLNKTAYDIALVDIDLNGTQSGIEIGNLLSNFYKRPFIFVTGNSDKDTIREAIKVKPAAYLQKPATPSTLFASVQTAIQNFENKQEPQYRQQNNTTDFFFVKTRHKLKRIDWKDVAALSASDNYTILLLADNTEHYIRCSLAMALKFQIPAHLQDRFIQVNRGEAVQIGFITEIIDEEIVTPVKRIYITKSFARDVKQRLKILG